MPQNSPPPFYVTPILEVPVQGANAIANALQLFCFLLAFAGFKNCCTHRKGWGISVVLSKCKAEEINLAERCENGLCHEIGGCGMDLSKGEGA